MFLNTTLISTLQLHYQALNEPQYIVIFYVKYVIKTCLIFYLKEDYMNWTLSCSFSYRLQELRK